jgi:hypothetical protein
MKLMLSGIALLALLTACDDSDSDSADPELDSGTSASTEETTSSEETTSDDGKGEDASAASGDASAPLPPPPPPPEPISCGDVDCPAPPYGTPCCATADDVDVHASLTEGACGVDLSPVFGGPSACVEFNQPGEPDESCPPLEIEGFDPIPGCCTSYGFCGTADTMIGIGCTTPPPEFGEPIPCGAGAGDAGGGSTGEDAGGGSTGEDAGGGSSSEDAGGGSSGEDAGEPATDAGASSEPMPDSGMSTMDAGGDAGSDASL